MYLDFNDLVTEMMLHCFDAQEKRDISQMTDKECEVLAYGICAAVSKRYRLEDGAHPLTTKSSALYVGAPFEVVHKAIRQIRHRMSI